MKNRKLGRSCGPDRVRFYLFLIGLLGVTMNIKGLSLFAFAIIFLSIFTLSIAADPIVREASGATPASIQAAVDQFRADLGALNPNTRQTFSTGRREINWDGVPEGSSVPNSLLPDFFNFNSPAG